jgi:hypothetical protein
MAFFRGPNVVTDGLVLALDAANPRSYVSGSSTWNDLSGNNNNGTLTNSPTYSSTNNGSIIFNGTNNTATFSNIPGPSFSFISSSFTTEFWINIPTSSLGHGFISSNQSVSNGGQYSFVVRSNNVYSSFYGTPTYTDVYGGPVIIGSWTHYVNTFNYTNQTSSIYVNGVLTGAGSMASSPLVTSSSLLIGRYTLGGAYLSGSMSSAKVYNRALSSSEVLQNYNALKSRFNLN